MKLKLRLRRRAGDEGTAGGKIKVILVIVLLLGLLGTVITWMHARSLIQYGPKDSAYTPVAERPLSGRIWAMLFGQTVPKPTGVADPSKYELPYQLVTIGGPNTRIYSEDEKRRWRERREQRQPKKDRIEDRNQPIPLRAWFIPELQPRGLAVLFHDYGQSKADLIEVAAEFHDLHFSVLMVDLRASGESPGRETTFGFYEARDVAQVMTKANDFTPAGGIKVIYAIGTGAAAVLKAASEKKLEADGMILEGVFDTMRHFVERRIKATGMSPVLISWATTWWIGHSEDFAARTHNPIEYARKVRIPALVLHGDRDPEGRKAEADAVAQVLNGRSVVIKGAGRPIANSKSDAWFDAVSRFVDAIPRPTFAPLESDAEGDPAPAAPDSTASAIP